MASRQNLFIDWNIGSDIQSVLYKAQAYAIGITTITFNDASRSRPIETKIFYPSDIGGVDEVIASGQFPVLVLGHGFLMGWDSYQVYWEELPS